MRQFVAPEWDGGAEIISAALRYSNGENPVVVHVERANEVLRRIWSTSGSEALGAKLSREMGAKITHTLARY